MFSNLSPADALVVAVTLPVVVPALVRALRMRSGAGLSVATHLTALYVYVSWLAYSLAAGLWLSAIAAAMFIVLYATLSRLAWFWGGDRGRSWVLPVVVVAVPAGYLLGGMTGTALVLGVTPLLIEAPQLRLLARGDAPALSAVSYGFAAVRALAWGPYAWQEQDVGLLLWVVSASLAAAAVTFFLLRARSPDPGWPGDALPGVGGPAP